MAEGAPKTFREFVTWTEQFPRGRRVVGWITSIGFFVFPCLIGVAYYVRAGFITYLALTFFWFLSWSHANFAFAQNLTQRRVRTIDYWYLGAAAVGLFLFAVGYEDQRETALTRIQMKMHQSGELPVIEDVKKSFADLENRMCDPSITSKATAPCVNIKKLAVDAHPGLSPKEITVLKDRLSDEVNMPYGRLFSPEQLSKGNIFMPAAVLSVRLDDWHRYMEDAPKADTRLKPADDDSALMFGLGQWVLWPFLLALALALRITKVTVDVFEWAK